MALLQKKAAWSPRLMAADDDSPEVGWVAIGELQYDWLTWDADGMPHGYQRPLDDLTVAKKIEDFDPRLIGVIVLSRRADGSLWVIDGQHRIAILTRLGKAVVLAEIHEGLTPEQEAGLFDGLNSNRKTPNQWVRFGSRGTAGDPRIAALIGLTKECGFRIGTADRSLSSIAAVTMLSRVYGWPQGPRLLRQVLLKIAEIWPTDVVARDGVFIEGLALLVWNFDGSYREIDSDTIDWRRFGDIFSRTRATEVQRRCKELKIEAGFAMNPSTYAVAFRDIYNGKANFTRRLVGHMLIPHASGGTSRFQSLTRNRVQGR